eukprot:scaffold1409_cov245-Pinguiococcus_pyrenoidosus.AAC.5
MAGRQFQRKEERFIVSQTSVLERKHPSLKPLHSTTSPTPPLNHSSTQPLLPSQSPPSPSGEIHKPSRDSKRNITSSFRHLLVLLPSPCKPLCFRALSGVHRGHPKQRLWCRRVDVEPTSQAQRQAVSRQLPVCLCRCRRRLCRWRPVDVT